jgi:hypothetical protein
MLSQSIISNSVYLEAISLYIMHTYCWVIVCQIHSTTSMSKKSHHTILYLLFSMFLILLFSYLYENENPELAAVISITCNRIFLKGWSIDRCLWLNVIICLPFLALILYWKIKVLLGQGLILFEFRLPSLVLIPERDLSVSLLKKS